MLKSLELGVKNMNGGDGVGGGGSFDCFMAFLEFCLMTKKMLKRKERWRG